MTHQLKDLRAQGIGTTGAGKKWHEVLFT